MSDTPGHASSHLDVGEVRHTLTIYDVERELERAGVGRSHRQVIRYCETGMLDAVKVPGPTGDQWFVSPASVPKAIADLKQWDTQRASRSVPEHATTVDDTAQELNKRDNDSARRGVPELAMPDKLDRPEVTVTEPATPRHATPDLDIYDHPYVKRLEDRVEKIEAKYEAQVRRTEEIQVESQRELMKLQQMIAVGQSQTLADFMLKAKDWLLTSGIQPKSGDANGANSQ